MSDDDRDRFFWTLMAVIAIATAAILAWGIPHVEQMRVECERAGGVLKFVVKRGHHCEMPRR